jgi:nucleoside-diphosphate-sugar epimerase
VRVVVLGGTRFIGRASVEELARAGHDVLVVHRGQLEPPELGHLEHLHADRAELASQRAALRDFKADAVLDCIALTRADADHAKQALPDAYRWVILSSMDVYRAYGALMAGTQSDRVPLDESSPVRTERFPYRDRGGDLADYDKLEVEDAFAERHATILRLPMVHGERDRQRREEFILRRVRAGRRRIPFGAGTWLTCRAYAGEVARAVRLALESESTRGQTFNLSERQTASVRLWAEQILQVAEFDAELVRVPDDVLPPDLEQTGAMSQHLQADPSKAAALLGWIHGDPLDGLRRSVRWHLANPPTDPDPGFEADDAALAAATSASRAS